MTPAAIRAWLDAPAERRRLLFLDLGRLGVFLFGVLAVTGILLAFHYQPDAAGGAGAHGSLVEVTNSVRFGWFVRSLHRVAGHALVVVAATYVLRGFFRRLFLTPRGVYAWPIAVGFAFACVLSLATGAALPWSQEAYWQTVVNANLLERVPVAGAFLADLVRGGPEVTDRTLVRVYAIHVLVLPWAAFGLLVLARDLRRRGDLA